MTVDVELFLYLLIFFQVKHFAADFILQNVWMLQKARAGWEFALPLAFHSGVHAVLTLVPVVYVNPTLWWLAVVDFVVHFLMDRIKAGPRYMGRYTDVRGKAFWVCFGFDQMVHHLTHIWICWFLVTHS